MDALSDLLQAVKLNGALFLEARLAAPFAVRSHGGRAARGPFQGLDHIVFFHIVLEGRFLVRLDATGETVEASAGDLILMPQDDTHVLASDPQLAAVDAETLVKPAPPGGIITVETGGAGEQARIMCAFLSCDRQLSRPLLDALPRIVRVPLRDDPGAGWLTSLQRRGELESATSGPGSATLLAKLAELMFVEAVRRHIAALPEEETGWLAGLRDRHVGRALGLMHGRPAHDWSLEELAESVGLSRSALGERFARLLGQPPMQYLTRWRLVLAAAELHTGQRAIARVAEHSGYESVSAFNRAFKREFGIPPAAWRRKWTKDPKAG